ncbi:hypothetical protein LEM8419_00091 [Neolewinella maritima]|uniref:Uncharacterized protein n=1 Tax=Neolewinella maritima TaxID=1383882 RepID=A0ABM9AVT3_9BACT|nr:hypothetical protein [Neolewinella maritima]CAH0998743.1 hypothetical protein LEM8419_00091 [Neolewinella maritima]
MPLTDPAPVPTQSGPAKKRSTLRTIVYVIILLVALSLILQVLGFGVLDQREDNTLIEQPHIE